MTSKLLPYFIILLFPISVTAQSITTPKDTTHYTRNFAYTTPVSKNTTINGISIGLMPEVWMGAKHLTINGLNISLDPLSGTFGMAYALFGTAVAAFRSDTTEQYANDIFYHNMYPEAPDGYDVIIRGISISIGGLGGSIKMHGLAINGAICFPDKMVGMEITGFMNKHYDFKGLMIAGLRNKTTTGKGVQIALFNSCKEGKVVQFGLINKIGKRVLPIMNVSL